MLWQQSTINNYQKKNQQHTNNIPPRAVCETDVQEQLWQRETEGKESSLRLHSRDSDKGKQEGNHGSVSILWPPGYINPNYTQSHRSSSVSAYAQEFLTASVTAVL